MGHAKPLFLIDDQKSQVLVLNIFAQQSVGSDDNVHRAFFDSFYGFLLLGRCPQTAEQFHIDTVMAHALGKGVIVLSCQDRGRHQKRHLLAAHYCLKRCPDGHLRLAIAYISADKTVHDLAAFHIVLCIFYSL